MKKLYRSKLKFMKFAEIWSYPFLSWLRIRRVTDMKIWTKYLLPISTLINTKIKDYSGQYNSILSRIIHYFCLPKSPTYKSEPILNYLYRLTYRYKSAHTINYAVNSLITQLDPYAMFIFKISHSINFIYYSTFNQSYFAIGVIFWNRICAIFLYW